MEWFRMYHEARNNKKLESLTDAHFRVWFRLLCYAAEQPERGTIESVDDSLLALEVAGGDLLLLEETLQRLVSLKMVSVNCRATGATDATDATKGPLHARCINFLNFAKRQRDCNGMTSTERSRKFRKKKKLEVLTNSPMQRLATDATDATLEQIQRREEKYYIPIHPREEQVYEATPIADSSQLTSTPQRTPEDRESIKAAWKILANGLDTEPIARELDRMENQTGYVTIPGWKFHVAAEKHVLLSDPGKRRSPKYYFAVVRGIGNDEKPGSPQTSSLPLNGNGKPKFDSEEWARNMEKRIAESKAKVNADLRRIHCK